TLQAGNWDLFDALARVTDERHTAAEAIRRRIADALAADEYVVRFAPELRAAQSEAVKLLSQPPVAPPPTKPGRRRVDGARVRERLGQSEDDGHRLMLITTLSESDLGEDVVARLARRRLAPIDPWEGAVRLFQASKADPRLRRDGWMANALIESAPPNGYPAV